jgi:uncharacterized membrane protein (DUF4010 family)
MREPELRGAFRIPTGTAGVTTLAVIPMLVLVAVVTLEMQDGEFGFPAVIASLVAAALGPIMYKIVKAHLHAPSVRRTERDDGDDG